MNCDNFKKHISKAEEVREAYKKDKSRVHDLFMQSDLDKSEVYLSSDMQKVIFLQRLPGFKLCLFTKRVVTINQSFAPIKNKETKINIQPIGIWHEGIMGRLH